MDVQRSDRSNRLSDKDAILQNKFEAGRTFFYYYVINDNIEQVKHKQLMNWLFITW